MTDFSSRLSASGTRWSNRLMIVVGLMIPLSTSLTEICIVWMFTAWLLSRDYAGRVREMLSRPAVSLFLVMFLLVLAGLCYGPANWADAGRTLQKHRKLLYAPIFFIILRSSTTRHQTIRAFQFAMVISLLAGLLCYLGLWEADGNKKYSPFKNYLAESVLMAFFAFTLFLEWKRSPQWRWLCLGLATCAGIYTFGLLTSRTGYGLFLVLSVLSCWQLFRWRGLVLGTATAAATACLLYASVPHVQSRLDHAVEQTASYYSTGGKSRLLSVGKRLKYYEISWELGCERPVFGWGTGGFRHAYRITAKQQATYMTMNPHNQYLFNFVEQGVVGLLVFVGIIVFVLWESRLLPWYEQSIARAIGLLMACGCLFNSFLLDVTEGTICILFIAWSSACVAEIKRAPAAVDTDSDLEYELKQAA